MQDGLKIEHINGPALLVTFIRFYKVNPAPSVAWVWWHLQTPFQTVTEEKLILCVIVLLWAPDNVKKQWESNVEPLLQCHEEPSSCMTLLQMSCV